MLDRPTSSAMRVLLFQVLAGLAVIRPVFADTKFLRPPDSGPNGDFSDNPTYKIGDTLNIQWDTNLKEVDLLLWQSPDDDGTGPQRLLTSSGSTSYQWTVSDAFFPGDRDGITYFFQLFNTSATSPDGGSHYFNITQATTSTTSTSMTSTSTSTSSTTISGTPTSVPIPIESNPSSSSSSSGLSSGAIAGIAVGVALAAIFAALAAFLLIRRRRKQSQGAAGAAYHPANGGPGDHTPSAMASPETAHSGMVGGGGAAAAWKYPLPNGPTDHIQQQQHSPYGQPQELGTQNPPQFPHELSSQPMPRQQHELPG
ncbi:hypothetical protein F4778DRAFT_94638 [Xylariomycetidae sp. FL2044]|nr:hypothetical protein F4778DRAFT_94638 [Xylariomycetidae sp. FL2044]